MGTTNLQEPVSSGAAAVCANSRQTLRHGRERVAIEGVTPEFDSGRFAIKRVIGERVVVEADIFADGHDLVAGALLFRHSSDRCWGEVPLAPIGNDRWRAEFHVSQLGCYLYTLHAWVDHFGSWQRDLLKRVQAGQDANIDYLIGAELVEAAAQRASGIDRSSLDAVVQLLRADAAIERKRAVASGSELTALMRRHIDRSLASEYQRTLRVTVDPERARFSSWYEFFPRSAADSVRHGTLEDCEARLPYVASMGFDVVYLPPIHPIGITFRKGKNNAVAAADNDVGSPWAIGSAEGGHKSIHPQLGTLDEFRRFVQKAASLGIDVALDIAFQVSPDHPYVTSHPEWFRKRPDGTIQYAENPPKKYQDIYPFDFETTEWRELWEELASVFRFWIANGVHIFRVDNPHTKAFPFWEWVIGEIKAEHPEAIFLAEAFTRPKVMYRLARLGFTQSYTYFPWRNTKHDITSYMTELTQTPVREFFRPNHWPNTPDILTEFLQIGGHAAFMMRFVLAATLGANYGIYGPAFELGESEPRESGSEEYLDSEKYQIREWDLNRPDSFREFITLVNRIRKENTALQNDWTLRFHTISNEQLICYSKQSSNRENLVVIVVNLDPHHAHGGFVDLPLAEMHIDSATPYQAHDLLTGARYIWQGGRNYVELNPGSVPAHIFRIRRRLRTEKQFEYFL